MGSEPILYAFQALTVYTKIKGQLNRAEINRIKDGKCQYTFIPNPFDNNCNFYMYCLRILTFTVREVSLVIQLMGH